MLKITACSAVLLALCGCSQPGPKAQKQYPLTGKVVSVNVKERTAMIDAAAIPNFMDAMKMDYPMAPDADVASLHVGDMITATVKVEDDGAYSLSNIHKGPANAGK
jgi:Cu/Ag efflux protein CusF